DPRGLFVFVEEQTQTFGEGDLRGIDAADLRELFAHRGDGCFVTRTEADSALRAEVDRLRPTRLGRAVRSGHGENPSTDSLAPNVREMKVAATLWVVECGRWRDRDLRTASILFETRTPGQQPARTSLTRHTYTGLRPARPGGRMTGPGPSRFALECGTRLRRPPPTSFVGGSLRGRLRH